MIPKQKYNEFLEKIQTGHPDWSRERCKKFLTNEIFAAFAEPQAQDNEIAGEYKKIEQMAIFNAGVHWNSYTKQNQLFTIEDLDQIVKNTNALIKTGMAKPPMKLGHNEEQTLLQADGYPAAGYAKFLQRIGDTIYADVDYVPKKIYDLIKLHAYDDISSEILMNYEHPITGENIGYILKAIALLGDQWPEVKGLGSILSRYNDQKNEKNQFAVMTFAAKNLQEVKIMKEKYTKEEACKRAPCCKDMILKFCTDNKTETIMYDKLAEIVSKNQSAKFAEDANAEQPVCVDGYKWSVEKQICEPANHDADMTKPDEQKMCPPGWKYDAGVSHCVKIEEATTNAAGQGASGEGQKKKKTVKEMFAEVMKSAGKTIDDKKEY